MQEALKRFPKPLLYFLIGFLIGGGILYYFGYEGGLIANQRAVTQCQERLSIINQALEKAVNEKTQMEAEMVRVKAEIEDLKRFLEEMRDVLSNRTSSGNYDDLVFSTPALHVIDGNPFCVKIHVKNNSSLQKIVRMRLTGMGVSGEERPTSIGPGAELNVPLCGSVSKDVSRVTVEADGKAVLSFYVVVST